MANEPKKMFEWQERYKQDGASIFNAHAIKSIHLIQNVLKTNQNEFNS